MPHLHLSLQAGDDLILKRMKRRHSRAQALAVAARARDLRPGIALGADLIAGFPTETEAMFANTLSLVEEAGLDYLHVFPFSPRPGTPAARMPQVPPRHRPRARGPSARGGRARPGAVAGGPRRVGFGRAGRARRFRPQRALRPGHVQAPARGRRGREHANGVDRRGLADRGAGMTDTEEKKRSWFGRLRTGLSRSSTKIGDGITGIFAKRRLDDEALRRIGGIADLGRSRLGFGERGDNPAAPRQVQPGSGSRGNPPDAGADHRAVPATGRAAAGARSRPQAHRHSGGRRQRQRQDHHHRQAGEAVPRRGQERGAGRRRHVPRRRGRAAQDLGRARRGAGGGGTGGRRPCRAGVRGAGKSAARQAPTCC